MKVLLRNQKTRLYVTRAEQWTPNRDQARDFAKSLVAVQHVSLRRMPDMEAVLTFGEPRYDLIIPLLQPYPVRPSLAM